jgi:hypothetical protein
MRMDWWSFGIVLNNRCRRWDQKKKKRKRNENWPVRHFFFYLYFLGYQMITIALQTGLKKRRVVYVQDNLWEKIRYLANEKKTSPSDVLRIVLLNFFNDEQMLQVLLND